MRSILAILAVSALCQSPVGAHDGHVQPPWQRATEWPDRIVVTLPGNPATSFAVTWRTDLSVPIGIAQIAPATSDSRFDLAAKTINAKATMVQLDAIERDEGTVEVAQNQGLSRVFYHTALFEDLRADTLYAYRVRGANDKFSPWRQVRTAPASGQVSILFFGDAQRGFVRT